MAHIGELLSNDTLPIELDQCLECGERTLTVVDDKQQYEVRYSCSSCGYEDNDSYADLYGVMSVPWGFAL